LPRFSGTGGFAVFGVRPAPNPIPQVYLKTVATPSQSTTTAPEGCWPPLSAFAKPCVVPPAGAVIAGRFPAGSSGRFRAPPVLFPAGGPRLQGLPARPDVAACCRLCLWSRLHG